MTSAPTNRLYRLRTMVDGVERTIDLAAGEYLVGSSPAADVLLPFSGISRQHARLLLSSGTLAVEDLGSKNGVRVDGARVERAEVPAGAELCFGAACFRVEAVADEDDGLAIVLEELPPSGEGQEPAETSWVPADTSTGGVGYPDLVFPERYRPGVSPPMTALYAQMQSLLRGDLPVLIHGETGVGKEMVARILYDSSDRRGGPFVAINCAAIPPDLLEAEMFGIGKGVATGVGARRGKFELAEDGTLFLDEIGEMSSALQAKLLRALQEKEIQPLGRPPKKIDVRVVSATNVDLGVHMAKGALRPDLYYRLAGFVLEVPPLRRCPEDIPVLVEHFLRLFAETSAIRIRGITVEALRILTSWDWPGNIRELENEVRGLVQLSAGGGVISGERLSRRLRRPAPATDAVGRFVAELATLDLPAAVTAIEESMIREALRRTGGNKSEACRLLGLSRNGLKTKMRRLGI